MEQREARGLAFKYRSGTGFGALSECQNQVCASHEAGLDADHLGQLPLKVLDRRHADAGTHGYVQLLELLAGLCSGSQCPVGRCLAERVGEGVDGLLPSMWQACAHLLLCELTAAGQVEVV